MDQKQLTDEALVVLGFPTIGKTTYALKHHEATDADFGVIRTMCHSEARAVNVLQRLINTAQCGEVLITNEPLDVIRPDVVILPNYPVETGWERAQSRSNNSISRETMEKWWHRDVNPKAPAESRWWRAAARSNVPLVFAPDLEIAMEMLPGVMRMHRNSHASFSDFPPTVDVFHIGPTGSVYEHVEAFF